MKQCCMLACMYSIYHSTQMSSGFAKTTKGPCILLAISCFTEVCLADHKCIVGQQCAALTVVSLWSMGTIWSLLLAWNHAKCEKVACKVNIFSTYLPAGCKLQEAWVLCAVPSRCCVWCIGQNGLTVLLNFVRMCAAMAMLCCNVRISVARRALSLSDFESNRIPKGRGHMLNPLRNTTHIRSADSFAIKYIAVCISGVHGPQNASKMTVLFGTASKSHFDIQHARSICHNYTDSS